MCVDFYLGPCVSTMLFLVLWLCSITCSQQRLYLWQCFYCSGSFWLIRVFHASVWLLIQFVWRTALDFWQGLHSIYRLVLVKWLCHHVNSTNPCAQEGSLVSSSISLCSKERMCRHFCESACGVQSSALDVLLQAICFGFFVQSLWLAWNLTSKLGFWSAKPMSASQDVGLMPAAP